MIVQVADFDLVDRRDAPVVRDEGGRPTKARSRKVDRVRAGRSSRARRRRLRPFRAPLGRLTGAAPPLRIFMARMARDAVLVGRNRSGHVMAAVHAVVIASVVAAVLGLLILELG